MSDWAAIATWADGEAMQATNVAFEVRNAEGLVMQTRWTAEVPAVPESWLSAPTEWRSISFPAPSPSCDIPTG